MDPREMSGVADWVRSRVSMSTRRRVANIRLQARLGNARYRTLPDFLVIGAQRCGTSSIYKYLGQHPLVIPSLRKEVDFFSTRYFEGEDWYRAHFPLTIRRAVAKAHGADFQTFEATPDYLLHPYAPARAAALVPNVKIVVLVRDPVDRAYSHYLHNRRLGQEPLDFEGALDLEASRLSNEIARLRHDPEYSVRPLRRFSYVSRGMYAVQVRRWLDHYIRQNVVILSSNELFTESSDAYRKLLCFLGLPSWQPRSFRNYSRLTSVHDYEPMPTHLRQRLIEIFAEPNQEFYDLVDRDFGWQR